MTAATENPLTPRRRTKAAPFGEALTHRLLAPLRGKNRLFLVIVVLPTLLAIVYFGFIAADVYVSESRFVVRSPERQTASPLGMLLKGTSFARSQDDTYSVQDFILSRDALRILEDKLAISKAYSNPQVDVFSRFAALTGNDSFEALYRYYQDKVTLLLDTSSSISTLTVRAFTAADSFRINEQLLNLGEALVNQLNASGRQDMIRFAAQEMQVAEAKAKAAALALSNYRNQKSVIDPERESTFQLGQIAKLQDALLGAQARIAQLRAFAKNNPQIPPLQQQIEHLQREIEVEMDQVAGGDRSLADKAAEYQRLALEREFADKQLASALVSLEQARNEAQRKQLYLERIVQPSKQDYAMEPRRLRSIVVTLLLGITAWGILSMLIAGIKEHHD